MRILVSGGAGFIGSRFIDLLADGKPEIVCVDLLTYAGCISNVSGHIKSGRINFVCADVRDGEAMDKLFRGFKPEVVVNFATESHVDRSIEAPLLFADTNYYGTAVLLEKARKYGVKRFHQVSTDEVYGDLPLSGGIPFGERAALKPSSPYSASKAAADLLALSYHRTFGLNVTVSRCSNNYGMRQFPEKLIPMTVMNALNGRNIPLYGDGKNMRDWISVEDHIGAIMLILERGKAGEVYNIASGEERENRDIVSSVLSLMELDDSLISFTADRPGHDLRYSINTEKIAALGFKPKVSLDSGLAATVKWYVDNREYLDKIASGDYLKENALYKEGGIPWQR